MKVLAGLCNAFVVSGFSSSTESVVDVQITSKPQWRISEYLSSMSLVYAWAPDSVYSNGSMATWASTNRVTTARYPAGMASYWNWEQPTGRMGVSSLDPDWDGEVAPEEDWMSLSEYLDLAEAAGFRPLIGANYNCHKSFWVNESASIARAVRQVEYVKSRGFTGAFWYIGNEDEAPQHAERIMKHAEAMKKVDPTMKVFWNNNNMGPNNLQDFLNSTGDVMDGAEFHGKWPYGGKPKLKAFTVQDWMAEVPLIEHKSNETWRDKLKNLRAAARAAGRPELLLANNEFGLGKPSSAFSDEDGAWNKYLKSLVAVEFALEMYISGYDIAVFWDNGDGGSKDHRDHMLMDTSEGYRFNPMHFGFEMLALSTNASMLEMSTSIKTVHGFAALTEQQELLVYLINKQNQKVQSKISLPATASSKQSLSSLVDTDDHWGQVEATTAKYCSNNDSNTACVVELPAMSFSLLRVPLDAVVV